MDLEETLADSKDPATAFRYFWLLFRREAFEAAPVEREGETVPLCLLDNLYLESQDYARELGESLKARAGHPQGRALSGKRQTRAQSLRVVLHSRPHCGLHCGKRRGTGPAG